jgi:ParB family chromosome partitioning protein
MQRKALGRGLEALIPPLATQEVGEGAMEIPLTQVSPNPYQPRGEFGSQAIEELAASIRLNGVLQPVLVRMDPAGGYQLVAGERRWRAARAAGLERIPAVVRETSDAEMLELALVENIQRENLNPIEEAKAYQALALRLGLTHDQISQRVAKDRSSVSNTLRLLDLPAEVQDMVSRGTLSAGHARAVLAIASRNEQVSAARYVAAKGFSVRRTEAFVQRRLRRHRSRAHTALRGGLDEIQTRLQQRFSTRVRIKPGRKGGSVEFEYYGPEDLERLLEAWGVT